jgi:predicted N-acetyltransferase YhbS
LIWSVRPTEARDRESIIAVVGDAFANGGRDGSEEVAIVRAVWALHAGVEGFDLVADDGGRVVGHVLGSTGHLGGRQVVGIAPLAVAPRSQGEGIGTALMTELLTRVERANEPLVVLLGLPAYYSRFGFEPAAALGISYPPVGGENPHFMVRRFEGYDASYQGTYVYCWEEGPG